LYYLVPVRRLAADPKNGQRGNEGDGLELEGKKVQTNGFYKVQTNGFYKVQTNGFYKVQTDGFYKVQTNGFYKTCVLRGRCLSYVGTNPGSKFCTWSQSYDF
jgi:hypothetical protein